MGSQFHEVDCSACNELSCLKRMMLSARDLQANCKAVQAAVKAAKTAYDKWFISNKLVQTFDAWGWGSGFAADDESGQSEQENERSDMSRYKIVDIMI